MRPGGADMLENRPEHVRRGEDLRSSGCPRALAGAGRERLADRTVQLRVLRIEAVDRVVARRPDGGAGEGAAGALRELCDEGEIGDAVDDVVEGVVRADPVAHDRAAGLARLACAEILRDSGEL